jgi:CheY-like chemotaxis protein
VVTVAGADASQAVLLAPAAPSPAPATAAAARAALGAALAGHRVLVVDDDESNRILLSRMLRNLGLLPAQLATAVDGLEAVDLVLASMCGGPAASFTAAAAVSATGRGAAAAGAAPATATAPTPAAAAAPAAAATAAAAPAAGGPPFTLLFVDRHMPRLTGDGAIRRLRGNGFTGFVAAVSGDSLEGERRDMLAAGANVVLPKPLTRSAVAAVLHSLTAAGPPATLRFSPP